MAIVIAIFKTMALTIENFLTNFLRSFPEPFSAREMLCMLNALNYNLTLDELTEFLDSDPRVFALQKKMYITRAGAFSGKVFSIVLTQKEIENKVLVPGDRCVPFVDNDMFSFNLRFEFLGKKLRSKKIELDKSSALDMFTLFGEEYNVQYIASDPACQDLKIAENDFELPPKITLTGVSLEPVFREAGTDRCTRILCRVKDWTAGIVEVYPMTEKKENPYSVTESDFARQKWNENLESFLLESFDRMGPCAGMEEQLANVFYEHSKELCTYSCGSVHEFLNWSKKIDIEYFGVETRLWYKGQEIPAVGKWNVKNCGTGNLRNIPFIARPEYIIDSFIKDQCYEKKNDVSELIEKIIPSGLRISEKEKKQLEMQIEDRNTVLRKGYNWFADFAFGQIRHKALDLFLKVENLVSDIDCNDREFQELPQQEMVTLSQLFTHITRILEITAGDMECADDETYAMQLSLEGMEANFEEIQPMIAGAMFDVRKKRFNVI